MEPQINADERRLNAITEAIIGAAYRVANELGCGFLEKPHENAMKIELELLGFKVQAQHPIAIRYRGHLIGEYYADLLINDEVIVELKAVKNLDDIHRAQCINYLKATGIKICLLINFGSTKIEIRRIVRQL